MREALGCPNTPENRAKAVDLPTFRARRSRTDPLGRCDQRIDARPPPYCISECRSHLITAQQSSELTALTWYANHNRRWRRRTKLLVHSPRARMNLSMSLALTMAGPIPSRSSSLSRNMNRSETPREFSLYKGISDRPLGWKPRRSSTKTPELGPTPRDTSMRRWDGAARTSTEWDGLRRVGLPCYFRLKAAGSHLHRIPSYGTQRETALFTYMAEVNQGGVQPSEFQ